MVKLIQAIALNAAFSGLHCFNGGRQLKWQMTLRFAELGCRFRDQNIAYIAATPADFWLVSWQDATEAADSLASVLL